LVGIHDMRDANYVNLLSP